MEAGSPRARQWWGRVLGGPASSLRPHGADGASERSEASGLSIGTSPRNKVWMLFCCEKTMHIFLKLSAHSWGGGGRGKTDMGEEGGGCTQLFSSFQPVCALATHFPAGEEHPCRGERVWSGAGHLRRSPQVT